MAKIILDIFLILLFIAVGSLQVYVIFRIKELKSNYTEFMKSQDEFVRSIEKARQSLMIVNSQAVDVLPELKKHIEESDNLMQDFSFVLARANKKIDVLQEMSSLNEAQQSASKDNVVVNDKPVYEESKPVSPMQSYQNQAKIAEKNTLEFEDDPVLARLEQLEQLEQKDTQDTDFLKTDNKRALQQQELIEKALKEIL